jgi:hypothetical protein
MLSPTIMINGKRKDSQSINLTIACAKQSFAYQASESLAYLKLSQQGSTESWGEAGNRQPKRRQG